MSIIVVESILLKGIECQYDDAEQEVQEEWC